MIKAFSLIFRPVATWQAIADPLKSPGVVLLLHNLPLLLLAALAEGFKLVNSGTPRAFSRVKVFTVPEAVLFELAQILLLVILIFITTATLRAFATTFHTRQTYRQAFNVVAYSLSPLFLLKLADGIPGISVWVPWMVGIGLCVNVLYYGIPVCMEPDPPHAFGLFLMTAITLLVGSGIVRFLAAWYLKGQFESLENAISSLAQQLPF